MGTSRNARLLLLIVLSSLAWKTSHSMEENNEEDRMEVPDVFCGLPERVDAASTNSISLRAGHLVLGFQEMCRNFPSAGGVGTEFRTADGTCNHPLNYGAANRPPKRLLDNAYDDGLNAPRMRGIDGQELPSATLVSRTIHPCKTVFEGFTVLLMQWGQFIDHDITGFPITTEVDRSISCCKDNGPFPCVPSNRECFPIRLTGSDVDGRFEGECMEFGRSVAAQDRSGKKLVPRQQINSVTSFIDASMMYGSSQKLQNELRERNSTTGELLARMRVSTVNGQILLPNNNEEDCIFNKTRGQFCFEAGDTRVNEHPLLAGFHTMFVRIHNIIVEWLATFKSDRSEEQTFQLARKIVGAIVQNIHYREWLPQIIGRATMRRFGLLHPFPTYEPSLDPRISNAFATAAFRFGHSLIPDTFHIAGEDFLLRQLFGQVFPLFNNVTDVYQALVRPMNGTGGAHILDRFFTKEVTSHLFETRPLNETSTQASNGLDLVALNIQRGRDHGLPPYNQYRKFCGLPVLSNFSDFPPPLNTLYSSIYRSPEDIDLFTGIMSEKRKFGLVGETLACLLGNQFRDLKLGDRFFYETSSQPEGFTPRQLFGIRRIRMAHLFCQVVDKSTRVQSNLFKVPSAKRNPLVPCSTFRRQFIKVLTTFK